MTSRRQTLFPVAIFCILLSGCTCGNGDENGDGEEYQPQMGNGCCMQSQDPTIIVAKALYCFSNENIYITCAESYRLTQNGDMHILPEETDEFCTGPCFNETDLMLDCIDKIMTNFQFYNKATTDDVRDTIKAGCAYGPKRGNFNVSEHIEAAEGNHGSEADATPLLGIIIMIVVQMLF